YRSPIFGHEAAAHPVIGPRPVDIMLDDGGAGRAASPDCLVQLIDRRLVESEWLVVGHRLALTPLDRSWRRTTRPANRHRSNRGGRNIARSAVSWAFRAGGTDAQKGDHVRNAQFSRRGARAAAGRRRAAPADSRPTGAGAGPAADDGGGA